MVGLQTVCLRKLGGTRAGEVRLGRWLGNRKVMAQEIISHACERTGGLVQGRHVLAIHDTSELNYQAHAGRVSGLGTVGNGKDVGMFIHPLLSVDADDGSCLGLAHLHHWCRTGKASPKYRKLPIQEKESYRWLEVAQAGKQSLSEAAMVTFVADRESDIYEEWARIPDERTHLLTRACCDRNLANGGKLYEWLDAQPIQQTYAFELASRPGKRSARTAQMSVRFGRVSIKRPASCSDKSAPEEVELSAIEVKELADSVPANEEPIHWRLLTTHEVTSVEQALRCVEWLREGRRLPRAPRTDPYVQDYRIRLLPQVCDA